MIKREFWEKISDVWTKEEEIEIPPIIDVPPVPDDLLDLDEVEDWNSLLKDLLGSDSDGNDINLDDLLSD